MKLRLFARTKDAITQPAVAQRLEKLERALELKTLDTQQAGVDREEAESAARLIEALKDTPEAVLRIGSLLMIKVTGPTGARIISRTLTTKEMIEIGRQPNLLESPGDLLRFIESRTSESPELLGAESANRAGP